MIAMECEADAVRPALRADDRLYVAGGGSMTGQYRGNRDRCLVVLACAMRVLANADAR